MIAHRLRMETAARILKLFAIWAASWRYQWIGILSSFEIETLRWCVLYLRTLYGRTILPKIVLQYWDEKPSPTRIHYVFYQRIMTFLILAYLARSHKIFPILARLLPSTALHLPKKSSWRFHASKKCVGCKSLCRIEISTSRTAVNIWIFTIFRYLRFLNHFYVV